MDNPGFQPDAEAALPNNRRPPPTPDRRCVKNALRQQQHHHQQQQQQQQQRVFSVSCRALDAPPLHNNNNNAGEAKAALAAAATPDHESARRCGSLLLLRLPGRWRRWEPGPESPTPASSPAPVGHALLALLLGAFAALALVAGAAVFAATVLEGPAPEVAAPRPTGVPEDAEVTVRGAFRLQPPPEGAQPLPADAIAELLSMVFRRFPQFSDAAAQLEGAEEAGAGRVRCALAFRAPAGAALAPRVGLHFLAALRPRAGRLWLGGRLPVDPRSVVFEEMGSMAVGPGVTSDADVEESPATEAPTLPSPAWTPWTAWSACDAMGTQRRTRLCRADAGRGEPAPDSEPCLLLPGGGGDLEVRDCKRAATVDAVLGGASRLQRVRAAEESPTSPPPPTPLPALVAPPSTPEPAPPAVEAVEATTSPTRESALSASDPAAEAPASESEPLRRCDACVDSEVCVALAGESLPACRVPLDPQDPTGCGGLCRVGRDVCHRLDVDALRCVEDSPCLAEEWRCGNQLCIPLVKRCDGHLNCYDHTDEFNCECDMKTHFHCGNGTSCLQRHKRCDHVIDCWDGSDELNCTQACPGPDEFTCSDGQCIPRAHFCDGLADCHDLSDEPFGCGGACKRHEWRCGNGRCVKKAAVCDGADDCGDGSDEANCPSGRLRRRLNLPPSTSA